MPVFPSLSGLPYIRKTRTNERKATRVAELRGGRHTQGEQQFFPAQLAAAAQCVRGYGRKIFPRKTYLGDTAAPGFLPGLHCCARAMATTCQAEIIVWLSVRAVGSIVRSGLRRTVSAIRVRTDANGGILARNVVTVPLPVLLDSGRCCHTADLTEDLAETVGNAWQHSRARNSDKAGKEGVFHHVLALLVEHYSKYPYTETMQNDHGDGFSSIGPGATWRYVSPFVGSPLKLGCTNIGWRPRVENHLASGMTVIRRWETSRTSGELEYQPGPNRLVPGGDVHPADRLERRL